jgi:hypothetical protein
MNRLDFYTSDILAVIGPIVSSTIEAPFLLFSFLSASIADLSFFDTLLAMRKASDGKGATLNITGKDVEEQELRLDKEPYGWSIAGLERLASLGITQDKVHSHIKSNPGLCWKEIKNDLEIHGGQLSTTLKKLVTNNIIEETEGAYHSLL